MDYKYWEDNQGRSPVLVMVREMEQTDARSAKSVTKHLQKLQKYPYEQLTRHKLVKKLKGKNPFKIHELRLTLPNKFARIFFIVARDTKAWLLHLIVKKSDSTPPKDIQVAEDRAGDLDRRIRYL